MAQVTCHACKAFFEVDFEPGTRFTCGSCGATLEVPAAAKPAPPTIRPKTAPPKAAPAPAPGRAMKPAGTTTPQPPKKAPAPMPAKRGRPVGGAAPGRPVASASASARPAAGGGDDKRKVLIIGSVAAIVLVAIVIGVVVSGGDESGGGGDNREVAGRGGQESSASADPYNVAWTKAQPRNGGTVDDIKRFGDMAWQRHQEGRGSADDLRKWESHWRWAAKRTLEREPDNALAHERLGDVLFDLEEAKALAELGSLTEDLRDDIYILIEDAEDKIKNLEKNGGRVWLSPKGRDKDMALLWKDLRSRADKARSDAESRATDSFYPTAQRFGETLAKEIANSKVDFRIDGVKEDPFAVHVHKPYVFLVQRSSTGFEDRTAQQWNDVLQSLQETFYRLSGKPCGVPEMTKPTPVVILASGEEYVKYNRRGDDQLPTRVTSAGHFEPGNNRLVCYRSTPDSERTTLFHEGTHQIVSWAMLKGMGARALTAGMRQALWFSEGIADYYGGHSEEYEGSSKVFVPGSINLGRIDTLVDAKKRGDLMPLEVLLDYTRAHYTKDNQNPSKSRTVLNAYAQGWALCYFIQNWKGEKYGAKWNDYVKGEFKGLSGKSAFTTIFGAADLPQMQQEYLEMIDALGEAKKNGKIVNGKVAK